MVWSVVSAIGSFLLESAQLLLGFGMGFGATLFHDWRRKRADDHKLASALVYQIRKAVTKLYELTKAMNQNTVIYSSSFSDSLWKQSEKDLADMSAEAYVNVDAFFAQLRNTDYLRDEFRGWQDKVLANSRDQNSLNSRDQCGNTLCLCVSSAIDYGNEALKALKPFAHSGALTATLPPRFYTEEEKQILGK